MLPRRPQTHGITRFDAVSTVALDAASIRCRAAGSLAGFGKWIAVILSTSCTCKGEAGAVACDSSHDKGTHQLTLAGFDPDPVLTYTAGREQAGQVFNKRQVAFS
jgi:hypothetical protein